MKKIIIFYSKTGGGHLSAAEAIADHLSMHDKNISIFLRDGFETTDLKVKTNPHAIFLLSSTKFLFLYNFLYKYTNNRLGVLTLRNIGRVLISKVLKKTVEEIQPDLIVSTHPGISPSILSLRLNSPFVAVCTDLGNPHLFWFDEKSDYQLIPDEIVKAFALSKTKIPSEKIYSLGYPLKAGFKINKEKSKRKNQILIIGGGAGTGKIEQQVKMLSLKFPGKKLVVVCGLNKNLYKKLKLENYPNTEVLGFVDFIPKLIRDSDIVITKAGPTTIIEAAILKKPLIITSWVLMQEKGNIEFVEKNNLGIYCPNIKKLPLAVEKIYKEYDKYSNGKLKLNHGSDKIAKFLLGLL